MVKSREKEKIRIRILRALKSQSPQERRRKSALIRRRLLNSKEYKSARTVLFYLSKGEEVQTDEMVEAALKDGKIVAVPVTFVKKRKLVCSRIENLGDLVEGPYGIRQPAQDEIDEVPVDQIDLAVVPGVAFDENLQRLGRGAGYYDRFLKGMPTAIPRVGIAFKFQVLKRLPVLSHDAPVTRLIAA